MEEQIKIQIIFKFTNDQTNGHGDYCDAIYMTLEEYQNTTPEELRAMERARVDQWIYNIENPPVSEPEEPIEEENGD